MRLWAFRNWDDNTIAIFATSDEAHEFKCKIDQYMIEHDNSHLKEFEDYTIEPVDVDPVDPIKWFFGESIHDED